MRSPTLRCHSGQHYRCGGFAQTGMKHKASPRSYHDGSDSPSHPNSRRRTNATTKARIISIATRIIGWSSLLCSHGRYRLHRRQSLYLPGLRCGRLPGARHRTDDVATSQLLPAPSLSACPCATGALREVRGQEDQRAMGARGWRLHPAVRGVGHGLGFSNAGQRRGPTGG